MILLTFASCLECYFNFGSCLVCLWRLQKFIMEFDLFSFFGGFGGILEHILDMESY